VAGTWASGPIAVNFAPNLYIGLTERDGEAPTAASAGRAPNDEFFVLPASVMFTVATPLRVGLLAGLQAPIDRFEDEYVVPVGAQVQLYLSRHLMFGGAFILERVLGGDLGGLDPEPTDLRSAAIYVEWMN
jgi:hypothetical protein